jgi:hypothetical protein
MASKNNLLDGILKGKTFEEQDAILQATANVNNSQLVVLKGILSDNNLLDVILAGKTVNDQSVVLPTKNQEELSVILNAIDPADLSSVYHFEEKEILDFEITSGDLVNEIEIKYGYNYSTSEYKNAITKHNPLSKTIYRTKKLTMELNMIQFTRQAEIIADAVLKTKSIPEIICLFIHDMKSIFVEVGDTVSISHSAGLGSGGYTNKLGTVSSKNNNDPAIDYSIIIKPNERLYSSELVKLSRIASAEEAGISIIYADGVATITVYADVEGNPPVEGAEVVINKVKKITDSKGQARFNLESGTYTANITASGYEDASITFTV